MIENWVFFSRFLMTFAVFLLYVLFFNYRQSREVARPRDGLTRLRWIILSVLLLTTVTLVPVMVYQLLISFGHDYGIMRNIISIVGGINVICSTFLLYLIFTYHIKEEKEDEND